MHVRGNGRSGCRVRRIRGVAPPTTAMLATAVLTMAVVGAACSSSDAGDVGGDPAAPATDSPPDDPRPDGAPIRVDQFGYRPGDRKVAVVADPEVGADADGSYDAGPTYEVRRLDDGEIVFVGEPVIWGDGEIHAQSGDRGWWFDFSAVVAPGSYEVVDVETGATSGPFDIADDVYDDVFDAALRALWFNRANTDHPEDLAGPWADAAAYGGTDQDGAARPVDDREAAPLDLRGGWFDAGDPNKYVTFAGEPVHLLLSAYERHPQVFDDGVGIPESGNGVPDVVDEIVWELDWLTRMQRDDGGVLAKVGSLDWTVPGTPSEQTAPRFYVDACSSSTIVAAGVFAHAATALAGVPGVDTARVDDWARRAEAAWDWYRATEPRDDCDSQEVKAGDSDLSIDDQRAEEVLAAVHLFALTDDDEYARVVRDGLGRTVLFGAGAVGAYRVDQIDALVEYAASRDDGIGAAITEGSASAAAGSWALSADPGSDLYRSAMPDDAYHWGSNQVQANVGISNLVLSPPGGIEEAGGSESALDHLHYLHGVNPLATVYVSNTESMGAERSVQTLFHHWFGPGTMFDVDAGSSVGVPPGFVVGGPNRSYSGTTTPPSGQPPQKSYRDFSGGDGEPVWEVTEPAIYYQAAYIRLLSEIIGSGDR